MGPIEKLVMFSFAMLVLPVGGFFTSKSMLFEGLSICNHSVTKEREGLVEGGRGVLLLSLLF